MDTNRKDATYYAHKIISASPQDKKGVSYYSKKIADLHQSNTICHHINEIAKIQEKNEVDSVKRYALFPILDEKGYEFYQRQEITHWSELEADFTADCKWYNTATPAVKRMVDTILAFFLVGDGVISKNIIFRFLMECETYEEQAMFISQLHIELIHAATYSLAASTFKRDPSSMAELIETAQKTECVRLKVEFMEKWMMADRPRYQRLVASACAEGIFFCTLFAVVFWFRSKGWFPNFVYFNELIGNDESLHRDWNAYLFEREVSKILSQYEAGSEQYKYATESIQLSVHEIVIEAASIEDKFAEYILQESIEDLNAADLKTYSHLIADNLLCQLSYAPYFKVSNPFTWINDISMEQKGNFYEVRIGSYKKKSLREALNWRARAGLIQETTNIYEDPQSIDF